MDIPSMQLSQSSQSRFQRQGPSGPLWLFKGLRGPPYTYETWNCASCFARKNFHFKDHLLKVWKVQNGEEKAQAHADAEMNVSPFFKIYGCMVNKL